MKDVARYEAGLLKHLHSKHADIIEWITKDDPKIKGEAADRLKAALDTFAADFA